MPRRLKHIASVATNQTAQRVFPFAQTRSGHTWHSAPACRSAKSHLQCDTHDDRPSHPQWMI